MDHFEATSLIIFIQRELFKLLVLERRIRHRELLNEYNLMREFGTGDIMFVSKQLNARGKYGVNQKLLLKTKVPYRVLEKDTPGSYWLQSFLFSEGLWSTRTKVKG